MSDSSYSAANRPANPPTATVLQALAAATDRLLGTIDRMTARDFAAPSALPGWTWAHVLAHLALNAKALAGVLTKLGEPDALPMYASDERRNRDIERLAAEPPARVADRVAIGASVLAMHLGGGPAPEDALESVGAAGQVAGLVADARAEHGEAPDARAEHGEAADARASAAPVGAPDAGRRGPGAAPGATPGAAQAPTRPRDDVPGTFARSVRDAGSAIREWTVDGTFERTPGGRMMAAAEIPYMRWREVEIHHADLQAGYTAHDWAPEFVAYVLPLAAFDRAAELDLRLSPSGRDELRLGAGGPAVGGSAADLAWWLLGRGSGEGLTGKLPPLGPWVSR